MTEKTYPTTWPCPVHEAAELFPLMAGDEFQGLVQNIKTYGLRDPIVLTADGKLLDGRNRFRACLVADVSPKFITFRGPGKAFQYVISVNLHRRHLTTSQKAMIAAKIATLDQGARTDLASKEAMSQPEAAEAMKVSRSSVQRAKQVIEEGTRELAKAVEDGDISLGAATEIVTLPREEQREAVKQVKKGAKPSTVVPKKTTTMPEEVEEDAETRPGVRAELQALCDHAVWVFDTTCEDLERLLARCPDADLADVEQLLDDLLQDVLTLESGLEKLGDDLAAKQYEVWKKENRSSETAPEPPPTPASKRGKK